MHLKQSFCYPLFKSADMTLDALCKTASEIGFVGIELWFRDKTLTELATAAQHHGLVIASMCGHTSQTNGLNCSSEHPRIEAELRESLAVAADLGIPNLICFSGNRNEGQTKADAIDTMARCLSRIAPEAQRLGVNLNIELLNSKVDHPGYQCDHTATGVAVCEKVASPQVKLLYDIYHMQIMEGDVIHTIRENIRWIGHFHTAGNPGRHDLDQTQELYYPAICCAISQTGYNGFIAHEFNPIGNDKLASLQHAYEICLA